MRAQGRRHHLTEFGRAYARLRCTDADERLYQEAVCCSRLLAETPGESHRRSSIQRASDGGADGHRDFDSSAASDNPAQSTSRPKPGRAAVLEATEASVLDPLLVRAQGELHLRRIDLADEVRMVNPGGYIGEATRREIAYALSKRVTYFHELAMRDSWSVSPTRSPADSMARPACRLRCPGSRKAHGHAAVS
jgi:hypothetical protein